VNPDPLILVLFLATWGGMLWIFRRLADDFRTATVRSSQQTAAQTTQAAETVPSPAEPPTQLPGAENLAQLAAELQQTADALEGALARRTERLNELMAEADRRIATLALATAGTTGTTGTGVGGTVVPDSEHGPTRRSAPTEDTPLPLPVVANSVGPDVGADLRVGPLSELPQAAVLAEPSFASPTPGLRPALAGERAPIDEVRRLAAQGHDPDTIARLTNRGREEVRLLVQRP
jgi:hypothetical protein